MPTILLYNQAPVPQTLSSKIVQIKLNAGRMNRKLFEIHRRVTVVLFILLRPKALPHVSSKQQQGYQGLRNFLIFEFSL